MKKSSIIGIIVATLILFLIFVILVTVLFLKLFKTREALSVEEFETIMENKGYRVVDVKEKQFSEYDYVENVLLAINDDYQFEFYNFIDENYAKNFFLSCQENFESDKGDTSSRATINFRNGSKFILTTDGEIRGITRINNTAIYIRTDEEHGDEIKGILNEINY